MASQISGVKQVTLGATKIMTRKRRDLRAVTPHVAQNNTNRRSAIDGRTTQHPGYAISQKKRKRIEELRWMKIIGMLKKVKLRGQKVSWLFTCVAQSNLYRLQRLEAPAT